MDASGLGVKRLIDSNRHLASGSEFLVLKMLNIMKFLVDSVYNRSPLFSPV